MPICSASDDRQHSTARRPGVLSWHTSRAAGVLSVADELLCPHSAAAVECVRIVVPTLRAPGTEGDGQASRRRDAAPACHQRSTLCTRWAYTARTRREARQSGWSQRATAPSASAGHQSLLVLLVPPDRGLRTISRRHFPLRLTRGARSSPHPASASSHRHSSHPNAAPCRRQSLCELQHRTLRTRTPSQPDLGRWTDQKRRTQDRDRASSAPAARAALRCE
jgi:hypothetical protein